MSNFVKIKKDDKYFILNTESVESVFPDAPGSIIKLLNGDPIRTFAEIDDIAAALIPALKSGTVIDAVTIYPPQESAKPESTVEDKQITGGVMLNTEETIFRRRYYHNGAHAGFILYANESDFGDEMKEDIARKIEELGGKVEFKNIFIDTSAPAPSFRLGILSEECTSGDVGLTGDNVMFVCNVYENDNPKGQLFFGSTNGLSSDEIRLALSGLSFQERETIRAEAKNNINEKLKAKYGQSLDRTIVINIKDGEVN
ncbi:hypothetical protein V1951_17020 [Yersinia sp. 2544 StPb PI]|uniref:hypothetical protein n=1 Tax=unclassified Yersinia (in: enterobacteria) TaxID=2653513 RepID=UPI003B27CD6B